MDNLEDKLALDLKNTCGIYYYHDLTEIDDGLYLCDNYYIPKIFIPKELLFRYSKLTKNMQYLTCMPFRIETCPNMQDGYPYPSIYLCILSFLFMKN